MVMMMMMKGKKVIMMVIRSVCMQVSEEYDELFCRQAAGGGRMEARLDPDN